MAEEKRDWVQTVADAVPVKEAYADLVQPGAREVGGAIQRVGSLVNSALRPLRSIQLAWDRLFDRLDGWLAAQLADVPPEKIVEPAPHVAGSVLSGLVFAQDEPTLRDLFVKLLATAMQSDAQNLAHPAFAEFIRQMTPMEASLIKAFAECPGVPCVFVRSFGEFEPGEPRPRSDMSADEVMGLFGAYPWRSYREVATVTLLDARGAMTPGTYSTAMDNLQRLKLVELDRDRHIADREAYRVVATSSPALTYYDQIESEGRSVGVAGGAYYLTDFGLQFTAACVDLLAQSAVNQEPPPLPNEG